MKIKTFLIVFIGTLIILIGAATFIYTQLRVVEGINASELQDKLYKEDSEILAWAMGTVNPHALENLAIPVLGRAHGSGQWKPPNHRFHELKPQESVHV